MDKHLSKMIYILNALLLLMLARAVMAGNLSYIILNISLISLNTFSLYQVKREQKQLEKSRKRINELVMDIQYKPSPDSYELKLNDKVGWVMMTGNSKSLADTIQSISDYKCLCGDCEESIEVEVNKDGNYDIVFKLTPKGDK